MMSHMKSLLIMLLSVGLLISVSACGKRGDPVRPSDVVQDVSSS